MSDITVVPVSFQHKVVGISEKVAVVVATAVGPKGEAGDFELTSYYTKLEADALLSEKNRTYVTDTTPGLDAITGDIWFNDTARTIQVRAAGVWTSPIVDAGQY
jgi:hypothetical protein